MLVDFKGNNDSVAFGWEGVIGYEITPFSWKDFWWYDKSLDVVEGAGMDEFKKIMFKNLEDIGVDTNDIKNTKRILLDKIRDDLIRDGNMKCIGAPEYILKSILLEKEYQINLVKLKFENKEENVSFYVTPEEYVGIMDNTGKLIKTIGRK